MDPSLTIDGLVHLFADWFAILTHLFDDTMIVLVVMIGSDDVRGCKVKAA